MFAIPNALSRTIIISINADIKNLENLSHLFIFSLKSMPLLLIFRKLNTLTHNINIFPVIHGTFC